MRRLEAKGRLSGDEQIQDCGGLSTAVLLGADCLARAPSQDPIFWDAGHVAPPGCMDATRGPLIYADADELRA